MEYRYHPEIEGLKVNEDGTSVLLNEVPVVVKVRKNGNNPFRYIYLRKVIGLARLILECWDSLPATPKMTAKHKDGDYTNYHYSNLQWGNWGGNGRFPSKLNHELELEIIKKAKDGIGVCELGRQYGVSHTAIQSVIKKKSKK